MMSDFPKLDCDQQTVAMGVIVDAVTWMPH